MIDNSVIKLDNKNYFVVDTILHEGFKYVFCTNEDDLDDFIIQKEKNKDGKNYLVNLSTPEEFYNILKIFGEKNK